MIYYETESWSSLIFRFHATVWSRVLWKWLLISAYLCAAYWWCKHTENDLGKTKSNILGSTLSFLLVFRANTAYRRYWEGRTMLTAFFCDLREVVALGLVVLPGGVGNRNSRWSRRFGRAKKESDGELPATDHNDERACVERVNLVRWSLALAISMQLHTRILEEALTHTTLLRETKWHVDWDRYRIRQLTTEEEFKAIDSYVRQLIVPQTLWDYPALDERLSGAKGIWDGACPYDGPREYEVNTVPAMRLPNAVLYMLHEVVVGCINNPRRNNRLWGMPERFATIFISISSQMSRSFMEMSQVITTPLPFPYFHLCKTLLFIYFLAFPFFIEYELGFWANVVEQSFLTLALLGVDAIAIEFENPFGIDDNDLDFYEKIANFEEEVMYFIKLSGDAGCLESFTWCEMPAPLTQNCVSPIHHYLALTTQVQSDGDSPLIIPGGHVRKLGRRPTNTHEEEVEDFDSDYSDDS